MTKPKQPKVERPKPRALEQIISRRFANGEMLEALYAPLSVKTTLAHWNGREVKLLERYDSGTDSNLIPISTKNALLEHDVIKLPSYFEDFGSVEKLVAAIKSFIHRYVDLEEGFEVVAAHYVLLSWVYDRFRELPYLRLVGDYGSGKTRFLQVVGSICYKPIFASGASTLSPLFHMLDQFRGTLILDEADFRFSDAKAEVTKLLNNGHAAGFPVLRSEGNSKGSYSPRAFHVFGPKILATREHYSDPALESRLVSERAKAGSVRKDIPLSLPQTFEQEAQSLRNKLLMFRFRNWDKIDPDGLLLLDLPTNRIAQIYRPLLQLAVGKEAYSHIRDYAQTTHDMLSAFRSNGVEEHMLTAICRLLARGKVSLTVQAITHEYVKRFGHEHVNPVTAKWVGGILRNKLHLRTGKSNGVYVIAEGELPKLKALLKRFGMNEISTPQSPIAGSDSASSKSAVV